MLFDRDHGGVYIIKNFFLFLKTINKTMKNLHEIEITKGDLQYCIFAITKKCNLKCKWCFENSDYGTKNFLSTKEIIDIIKKLQGLKGISISGGEASLHPDIIKILSETKKACDDPHLLSNGIALNNTLLNFLKESNIRLTISMDGLKNNHELIRGVGTFNKAINSVNKAVRYGIMVSIQCTLSKNNLSDVKKLINLANKLNVNHISFMRMKPLGRGIGSKDDTLSSEEIKNIIYQINEHKKKSKVEIVFKDPLDNTINSELKKFSFENDCVAGGCRAGVESIYIEYNGDIFPCPFLRYKIGNALKNDPFKIFEKSIILQKIRQQINYSKCSKCENWLICRGCRAEPFLRNGDYLGDDIGCWH